MYVGGERGIKLYKILYICMGSTLKYLSSMTFELSVSCGYYIYPFVCLNFVIRTYYIIYINMFSKFVCSSF